MGSTLAQFTCIEDGIHLVAKLTHSRIKTNLTDIILDILVTAWDRLCRRRTEVECFAIRRKYRISLVMVFRHQERIQNQFMGCRLINKDIRCLVEDFDAFILYGMETLMSGIGTIGAIRARRMPVRINHRTLQGIILRLQPLPLAVLRNQGCTMVTTHMEGKLIWIGSICCMTIETGTRRSCILKDCSFLKVTQVALIDAQLAIHLITRSNATVSQSPVVQLVWADMNIEVLILRPVTILFHINGNFQISAPILSKQMMPFIDIEICVVAFTLKFTYL